MLTVDSAEFEKDVLESAVPVVVEFTASWSGPAKQMGLVVAALAARFEGRLSVVTVDIDAAPALAEAQKIEGVPTLLFFREGKERARLKGFVRRPAVEMEVRKLLCGDLR